MSNSGIIIVLAYPDTIVKVSDEWFSPLLPFVGVGRKNYVRAGHAALVLIEKDTGQFDYHDFGRYVTPESHGRVRGKSTDFELDFNLKAQISDGEIINLNEILKFLATHPELTHGEGKLIASVCDEVDYERARAYIKAMQSKVFVKYAVFKKNTSNCSRFVTDSLIASVTNESICKKLIKSKSFTPSTVGNVVIASTKDQVFEVSEKGKISSFTSSVRQENMRCFLDRLKAFEPTFEGSLHPKPIDGLHEQAQWLPGTGAGAWFELHKNGSTKDYRFRRVSAHGHIDVDGMYRVDDESFEYEYQFEFLHHSNCACFHMKQKGSIFKFERIKKF